MPDRQIFFDPQRKRWKRLRRILDAVAVLSTLVVVGFIFNILRIQRAARVAAADPRHNYRALPETAPFFCAARRASCPARRKTDPQTLRYPPQHRRRIARRLLRAGRSRQLLLAQRACSPDDMLFPQWLHVDSPNGTLMAMSGDNLREFPGHRGQYRPRSRRPQQGQERHSGDQKTLKSFPP